MGDSPQEITQLLVEIRKGNRAAESKLMPLVYQELRKLARRYMRLERRDHTLQTTALVHEAYVRLVDQRHVSWQNRAHFFAVAAQIMRRILVDHARAHQAAKRGGTDRGISLDDTMVFTEEKASDILVLDEALTRLSERDRRQCRIVELRFFGGLTEEEAAEALGISVRTVKRDWRIAKAWLYHQVSK